jgi:DNA-binding NarL/FixJ family response regulator
MRGLVTPHTYQTGVHQPMTEVRILIADDSPTVRAGLKLLLQFHENWTVCGEAEDGQDAVKKAAELKPDVILLDISMPAMDGLSAAEIIRRDAPEAEILIVTHFESLDLARYAAQTGVRAYITKSRIATDLEKAIEAASRHQSP